MSPIETLYALFIPNNTDILWLPVPNAGQPGACEALASQVNAPGWMPPPDVARQFVIDAAVYFRAVLQDGVVIITPNRALEPFDGLPAPNPSPEQAQILRLIGRGMTAGQIARSLGRGRRWVLYQLVALKRMYGVRTRAQLAAFAPADEGSE